MRVSNEDGSFNCEVTDLLCDGSKAACWEWIDTALDVTAEDEHASVAGLHSAPANQLLKISCVFLHPK